MTNSDAERILKYATFQMAAEAFWENLAVNGSDAVLAEGNDHSSKLTRTEIDQFNANGWSMVEYKSNTPSGFSGTLFRDESGRLVISFRSTEFVDDAARDNAATNTLEIREKGWAFGQIDDMQTWIKDLQARGVISENEPLTVTGYSLGGHLATAFSILNPELTASVYTFNGAGVGKVAIDHTLGEVINTFHTIRTNGEANVGLFSNSVAKNLYLELRQKYSDGQIPTLIDIAAVTLQAAGVTPLSESFGQFELLRQSLVRMRSILLEADRVRGLASSDSSIKAVSNSDIEAGTLDYQVAVLTAAKDSPDARRTRGDISFCRGWAVDPLDCIPARTRPIYYQPGATAQWGHPGLSRESS